MITDKVANNLELQALVLDTIEDYEKAGKSAKGRGLSLLETVTPKARKKQKTTQDIDYTKIRDGDKPVGRQRSIYAKWSSKWFTELFLFCESDLDLALLDALGHHERFPEMFEYAWGLEVTGEGNDKVVDVSQTKLALFEKLKDMYESNGAKLANFHQHIQNGVVHWISAGIFQIVSAGRKGPGRPFEVVVKSASLGKTAVVSQEHLAGDEGRFSLAANWSETSAATLPPATSWKLSFFFPAPGRKLRRQTSKEVGILSAVSAASMGLMNKAAPGSFAGTASRGSPGKLSSPSVAGP